MKMFMLVVGFILFNAPSLAGEQALGKATYLGNEAVMVEAGGRKILFDPFFHDVFNTYQLVPEAILDSLMNGIAPYDNINAVFISHAHGDHFHAPDLVRFLLKNPDTYLIAPEQAVEQLAQHEDFNHFKAQIISIDLKYKDAPIERVAADIQFGAVRIPHAGWPQRADVSNLVYRVTLPNGVTVVHMGDADPDATHFKLLTKYWAKKKTDTAFPPYWFLTHEGGQAILANSISAEHNIGIHVPVSVPAGLKTRGKKYFSEPGENADL